MKYTFFARDYYSNSGDFDFTQQHYHELINFCFTYGKYFSLVFWNDTAIGFDQLEKWRIPSPQFPFQNETFLEKRRFYTCCEASCSFLLNATDTIFDFECPNPEDIVFYREDGSVLVDSVAHEGECSIFPTYDEDASKLLEHGHWLEMADGSTFEEGIPCAPASEHQLEPSSSWDMFNEPLFIRLREVQLSTTYRGGMRDCGDLIVFIESVCDDIVQSLFCDSPVRQIKYVPAWYCAFRLYVLGECGAKTCERIPDALEKAGFCEKDGVYRFFDLLEQFISRYTIKTGDC